MRSRSWLALALASAACSGGCGGGGATADAGPDANECVPVTHVCVTDEFGAIAPGARVTATQDGAIPFEGTTGADGCVDLYPESGAWQLRAVTDRSCANAPYEHTVTGCGTSDVMLAADQCFDG